METILLSKCHNVEVTDSLFSDDRYSCSKCNKECNVNEGLINGQEQKYFTEMIVRGKNFLFEFVVPLKDVVEKDDKLLEH